MKNGSENGADEGSDNGSTNGEAMNLQQARSNMIEQQVRPWDVLDQRVLDVLALVPREDFVAEEHRALAYSDYQLPIGFGQTLLKPIIEGRLLQALSPQASDLALEIGTGSGYLTACLANMSNRVHSLEIHPELAQSAQSRLDSLDIDNVTLLQQDGAAEWETRESYDTIAFGGAVESIPPFYKSKMAINGRMFAVIGDTQQPMMEAVLLTRISKTEWTTESLFETKIDPLVNFSESASAFVF